MTEVQRKIKLVTQQNILADLPPVQAGFPMREWSIKLYLLGADGSEITASIFDKVTYKLHPTFQNPIRAIKKPPFTIQEQGWGEFDMEIVLHAIDKGGDHTVRHDLNFQKNKYESVHTLTFKNPRPNLLKALADSGSVPGATGNGAAAAADTNGAASAKRDKRKSEPEERASSKKKRAEKAVDMEKLADGLQKLQEDDLLKVVQMVHDNKTSDTYVKNDIDQGEFHVDLYTLPDHLVRMLWQFVQEAQDARGDV